MIATRRKLAGLAAGAAGALAAASRDDAQPDTLLGVFAKRQTVRKYKSTPVPDEHVGAILDAAQRAPTCMNQQPWKFMVVRDRRKIEAMRQATLDRLRPRLETLPKDDKRRVEGLAMTEGYFTAPVYVVVLVDKQAPCAGYAVSHDGPLAAGYLMLAARALGYGTVYLTDGIPDEVSKQVLAIPDRYQRICMTPIGVPDAWPERKSKKPLDELVVYETLEG